MQTKTMERVVEEGKYLTFKLADEYYGLEILRVREIIGMMTVTHVPGTPEFIRGIINLRGKVIPVMDLRRKFGLQDVEHTALTCIVVVEVSGVQIGAIVDEVSEVLNIAGKDIEEPPNFGNGVDTSFIIGIGKVKDRVMILLDTEKVISHDSDLSQILQLTRAPEEVPA